MYRRFLIVALAGLITAAASAKTLELVEGSYEAVLADVAFPSSVGGTLVVRMCGTCAPIALSVDATTAYVGTSGPMILSDFLANVADLRQTADGNQTTAVGVYYDLDTKRVTRVSLHAH